MRSASPYRDVAVVLGTKTRSSPPIVVVSLQRVNIEAIQDGSPILLKPEDTGLDCAIIVAWGGESEAEARAMVFRLLGKP
ncbi:MAG: hypothetical protein U1E23_09480 [Reyranellaceae bacterium]